MPIWFGPKARGGAFPIPREVPARISIPADVPPGVVHWQLANANGVSSRGRFLVSGQAELTERRVGDRPQRLARLPVTVSGPLA